MIVIIDNYDSFTYNLLQYYKQITSDVCVYKNDEVTVQQIERIHPHLIVLSPGPGTPEETGISRNIIEAFHQQTPIFGVCLGLQLIVEFFGGSIVKGPQPMHGKVTKVAHDQLGVFAQVPSPAYVTRYHSLIADSNTLPAQLEISSLDDKGTIMGIRHKKHPVEGVQFHPESILTEHGFQMIQNSYEQALLHRTEGVK
ncbi:anthranilate synthase component II [Lentibacillus sediminis]|uniref:anthranilate synthase component II n=1 Tax=Lentibacillus sediminis TaxID=1940529 RepID=UPI000C1C1E15|nr:aminodeoxychorismate/anthranilate synthase component II [Lentibacillus sediminis]